MRAEMIEKAIEAIEKDLQAAKVVMKYGDQVSDQYIRQLEYELIELTLLLDDEHDRILLQENEYESTAKR